VAARAREKGAGSRGGAQSARGLVHVGVRQQWAAARALGLWRRCARGDARRAGVHHRGTQCGEALDQQQREGRWHSWLSRAAQGRDTRRWGAPGCGRGMCGAAGGGRRWAGTRAASSRGARGGSAHGASRAATRRADGVASGRAKGGLGARPPGGGVAHKKEGRQQGTM
jgi:hypothetical protein